MEWLEPLDTVWNTVQHKVENVFLDPEGSQSATTVVVVVVGFVVTLFEKCLRLC